MCVSDWVWVKETWNINFNSKVALALEKQVNFLNQFGEDWNWENAFKEKCLGLCYNNYGVIDSGANRPPRFPNMSGAVSDLPENPTFSILLSLREMNSSHFSLFEVESVCN